MKLTELELSNFRNFRKCHVQFQSGLNWIIGENGQGKTSIIEGIDACINGRSFRTNDVGDLTFQNSNNGTTISNESYSFANIQFSNGKENGSVKLVVHDGKKRLLYNQKQESSLLRFYRDRFKRPERFLHSVLFHPEEHAIIRGSPIQRRSFFDRVFSRLQLSYLEDLSECGKLLKQRNQLLRNNLKNPSRSHFSNDVFDAYTHELANRSAKITLSRLLFIKEWEPVIAEFLREISGENTRFFFELDTPLNFEKGPENIRQFDEKSLQFFKALILKQFDEKRGLELRLGTTLVGPQRDDFRLIFDQRDSRSKASQGEARSIMLAVKLAEIYFCKKTLAVSPALFIDDFSSELDRKRRERLLKLVTESGLQTFVTSTDVEGLNSQLLGHAKMISVHSGSVS